MLAVSLQNSFSGDRVVKKEKVEEHLVFNSSNSSENKMKMYFY